MNLVVVAEPDLRERMRCIRIIADQTPVSALGAASWLELEQLLEDAPRVELVFYAGCLGGAPEDAADRLILRTKRLIWATDEEGAAPPVSPVITRSPRPISEETLVLSARALGAPSVVPHVSFVPVDFLQMICMSGGSHVLVLSGESGDAGVIEVRNGEVWTAFDGLGVGEDAFARLLRPEMRARRSGSATTTRFILGYRLSRSRNVRRSMIREGLSPGRMRSHSSKACTASSKRRCTKAAVPRANVSR